MIGEESKEQELINRIVGGDIAAMKELYGCYSGYLTAVCARYISNKDDVKDILQESFIKIFRSIENFEYKGKGSLKAWTTRIVVNESLRAIKKKEKQEIIKPTWDLPEVEEEDEESDFADIPTSLILEKIQSLPVGYRTVFNLYVFEKKSHKEIASILNITENTSASQLYRAKNYLVKQINEYRLTEIGEL